MTVIDVLDETAREHHLAAQITGMLTDTAELVSDITALTPPPVLRFRLMSPAAWSAESMAYLRREIEGRFAKSAPSPEEEAEARTAERLYRTGTADIWWMTHGSTVLDSAGRPQTLIAPKALHHTGLRYASNELYRFVLHESVHQWQITASRGAVMPLPILKRDIRQPDRALMHLVEGHAEWVVQQVAGRLFGPGRTPAPLRRSWRYRKQTAVIQWLARRVAQPAALEQAGDRMERIRSDGLRWVESVVEGIGVIPFSKVWEDQWCLPTEDEIADVEQWFHRVGF
ncbi:zinc-dependent metalloprotease [Streptomyces sp. 110]|uniref:Zinc-dependent metalloprotease n=1 Tax=Streptomyces endocoffeicus TaxID=2898945 RepID=A0ABS1PS76_9ACTN|nr:zinc-dependent metalloprotease [Streptomyces endocoffeicus]MBL1115283.1 zinc-dependent metalloprotease [Streptomyces endocoffeicus]